MPKYMEDMPNETEVSLSYSSDKPDGFLHIIKMVSLKQALESF